MSGFNNVLFARNHYTPHYSTPYRIERVTIHLKELDTTATIYPISNINEIPFNLIKFLAQEYNDEILRGDTLPFFEPLTEEEFTNYWFQQFTGIMCIGDEPDLNDDSITVNDWAKKCLGAFFIKSAYPGRCSHICTTNFLVNAGIRKRGIGFYICECFIRWAPTLGYSKCIVELVFETNLGGKRLLEKCGFIKVGKVNSCAILKSTKDLLIASYIFSKDLVIIEDAGESTKTKYDNILRYLSTGQYPVNATRQEKTRLRSLSYHYETVNNKLFFKGREVITDLDEQIRVTRQMHSYQHHGINKTTILVGTKYHFSKIKEIAKRVIGDCEYCKQISIDTSNKKSAKKRKLMNAINDSTNKSSSSSSSQNLPTLSTILNSDPIDQSPANANTIASLDTVENATRLDTEQIDTPGSVFLKETENMINIITMNSQAQSQSKSQNNLQYNTNSTPSTHPRQRAQSNTSGNQMQKDNIPRDSSDLVSMLNYYNGTNSKNYKRPISGYNNNNNDSGNIYNDPMNSQTEFNDNEFYNSRNNQFSKQNYNSLGINRVEDDDYDYNEDEDGDYEYTGNNEEEEEDYDDEDDENAEDDDEDDDDEDFGDQAEEDSDDDEPDPDDYAGQNAVGVETGTSIDTYGPGT